MDVTTLILLIALFVGILVWAFRPKNRRRFREDAEIPFHDDDRTGEREERRKRD